MTPEPEMNQLQEATESIREGYEVHRLHCLKGKPRIQRGGGGCLYLAHVSLKRPGGGGLSHPGLYTGELPEAFMVKKKKKMVHLKDRKRTQGEMAQRGSMGNRP